MKTKDEQRSKKYLPGFVSRHWQVWLCSISFMIPFVVGGTFGWFWVAASYDHLGQLTTDKDYAEASRRMRQESTTAFIHDGLLYGLCGLSIAACGILLINIRRRRAAKDESY